MSPMIETFFAKYGVVIVGITLGFAAKYALLIKKGVQIQLKLILADVLLLPMVALIAYWLVARAGLAGEASALFAALCTVGADRLVKLLTDRFVQGVDSEATRLAQNLLGQARQTVAAEQSAERIVTDTIDGRALTEYAALKPRPHAPKGAPDKL